MENTFSINRKQILSLTAAVIFLALAIIVPGGGALTKPMVSSIFLVLFALTLWIFEPIPLAISSFLVLLIAYLFGLTSSLNESFSGIAIAANWFYIPSMGIGMALLKTSFAQKMLANLLKISGTGAKKITLCFMLITYVLSAVMSDIAAVVLAVGFATEFVNQIKEDDVRKNFKRMVMVSLPIASLIGGTATPAGSTVNVMALSLLKTYNGVEITFVQWMGIGVPVSFIALLLAWFLPSRKSGSSSPGRCRCPTRPSPSSPAPRCSGCAPAAPATPSSGTLYHRRYAHGQTLSAALAIREAD